MNSGANQIAKIKIKPLRYTLMELRQINFLKRKGKPIPVDLLNKPFEDFDVGNQIKPKKSNKSMANLKIEEIKENNKENSSLTITLKKDNKEDEIENKNSSSIESGGILKLNICKENDDKSSEKSNED